MSKSVVLNWLRLYSQHAVKLSLTPSTFLLATFFSEHNGYCFTNFWVLSYMLKGFNKGTLLNYRKSKMKRAIPERVPSCATKPSIFRSLSCGRLMRGPPHVAKRSSRGANEVKHRAYCSHAKRNVFTGTKMASWQVLKLAPTDYQTAVARK